MEPPCYDFRMGYWLLIILLLCGIFLALSSGLSSGFSGFSSNMQIGGEVGIVAENQAPQSDGWVAYTARDASYQTAFPGPVQEDSRTKSAYAEKGGTQYWAEKIGGVDKNRLKDTTDAEWIAAVQQMSGGSSEVIDQSVTPYGSGRTIDISARETNGRVTEARFLVTETSLFSLAISHDGSDVDHADHRRFFEAFRPLR